MSSKNPLAVSYDDMIAEVSRTLSKMRLDYPALVHADKLSWRTARHRIATFEQLEKVLKRHKKDPQLNMNDLFNRLPPVKDVPEIPPGAIEEIADDPDLYTSPE